MNHKYVIASLILSSLIGCSLTMNMYPVRGPLTDKTPVPTIHLHLDGGPSPEPVSLVLPDGETCQGQWSSEIAKIPSSATQLGQNVTNNDIPVVWDEIFGQGYYLAKVVGAIHHGHGVLKGNHGTVINLDFLIRRGASIIGVAADNKGNYYKMLN